MVFLYSILNCDTESGCGFCHASHCDTVEEWRVLESQVIQPEPATQSRWKDVEEGCSGWCLVLVVFLVLILWLLPYIFTFCYCHVIVTVIVMLLSCYCYVTVTVTFCYCPKRSVTMPLDEFEQERVVPSVTELDMIDRAMNRFYHSW